MKEIASAMLLKEKMKNTANTVYYISSILLKKMENMEEACTIVL